MGSPTRLLLCASALAYALALQPPHLAPPTRAGGGGGGGGGVGGVVGGVGGGAVGGTLRLSPSARRTWSRASRTELCAAGTGPPTAATAATAEPQNRKASVSDWRTLCRLASADWPLILAAFGSLLLAAAGEVLTPQLQSATLNQALLGGATGLSAPLRKLAIVGTLTAVATGLRGYMFWICGAKLVARLRDALYASLLAKPQSFHDERAAGELSSRLSADCVRLGDVLSLNVNIVLRQLVQTAGGMAFVYRMNAKLAGLVLVGVFARSAWSAAYGRFSRKNADAQQAALAGASAVALQGLTLVPTVRAYGTQAHESSRYSKAVRKLLDLVERQGQLYGVSRVVTGALNAALLVATLALGGALVGSGQLAATELTALVLYTGFVSSASSDIGDQWARVQEALGAAAEVFSLLETTPTKPERLETPTNKDKMLETPKSHTLETPTRGRLEFDGVSFSYPSRPTPVLHNVTLGAAPGERLAIVGGSGSGKSTLLKLALRFYAPTQGRVVLDGVEVGDLGEAELRGLVTWLPQEPPLFPVTIRENIAYGSAAAVPLEAIEQAAREANCHEFIDRLPDKYETVVGDSGAGLSGGQRQRVAIARALLRDPAVLMLDEATSALDPESARLVEAALQRASANRSVILTTHKLEQARRCDRIAVMDGGALIEIGTHEELVARRGRYWEMLTRGLPMGEQS